MDNPDKDPGFGWLVSTKLSAVDRELQGNIRLRKATSLPCIQELLATSSVVINVECATPGLCAPKILSDLLLEVVHVLCCFPRTVESLDNGTNRNRRETLVSLGCTRYMPRGTA